MTSQQTMLHGTAVALDMKDGKKYAVLLRGSSGMGKSDLALRLIEEGGVLVSDDQVALSRHQKMIFANSVDAIKGLLEIRGVGLLHFPIVEAVPLRLVIDLCARESVPRLPLEKTMDILGCAIPCLSLYAFDVSSSLKVKKALAIAVDPKIGIR